jgi:hypothetical protein
MSRASRSRSSDEYDRSVFINCPFDDAYINLFRSIIFAVVHCGFRARCAQEIDDGGQVRIDKIVKIVEGCRYGIHDLSRTELDRVNQLPRFNMPLELGLFLGAHRFGAPLQRKKICLILDRDPYRYQKFISDIAGQDIRAHQEMERRAITLIRDWLGTSSGRIMPGGKHIYQQYRRLNGALPSLCRSLKLNKSEITFNDFTNIVTAWISAQGEPGV